MNVIFIAAYMAWSGACCIGVAMGESFVEAFKPQPRVVTPEEAARIIRVQR